MFNLLGFKFIQLCLDTLLVTFAAF